MPNALPCRSKRTYQTQAIADEILNDLRHRANEHRRRAARLITFHCPAHAGWHIMHVHTVVKRPRSTKRRAGRAKRFAAKHTRMENE